MKRFVFPLLALFMLVPALALCQQIAGMDAKLAWHTFEMRSTSAASVTQDKNWAKYAGAFTDSGVFRRGTGLTVYDTTKAYHVSTWKFPPTLASRPGLALSDTTMVAPWMVIRVRQDTTQYSWSGAVVMDSVYFGAQVSYDGGINWNSLSTATTKNFGAAFFTAGEDGLAPVALIMAEPSPGADAAMVSLGCVPSLFSANNTSAWVLNTTLCMCNALVRFIFAVDGTGQFVAEYASWD